MKTVGKFIGIIVGKIVGAGVTDRKTEPPAGVATFDSDLIKFDSDLYTFDQSNV